MAASTSSAAFYPPYPPSSSSSFASLTSFASSRNSRGVGEVIHTGRLEGRITRLKAERDQLRRLVKRLQSKIAATSTAQNAYMTTSLSHGQARAASERARRGRWYACRLRPNFVS